MEFNKPLLLAIILLAIPMSNAVSNTLVIQQGFTAILSNAGASSGTPPYNYQWFSECPSCSSFSLITGATNTIYYFGTNDITQQGTWQFLLQAKDNLNNVANSASTNVIVTQNKTLTILQDFTAVVAGGTASGGTPPYSYQWFSQCPSCSSFTSIPGATNTVYYFGTNDLTQLGTWQFLLQAKDSLSAVSNSIGTNVIVDLNGKTDLTIFTGFTAVISSNSASSGVPPYRYQWFSECPGCATFDVVAGATNTVYYFNTNSLTQQGTWQFLLQAKDNINTVSNSIGTNVIVQPVPSLISIGWMASNGLIDQGQYQTLNSIISGGIGPYTYNILVYNSVGTLVANGLYRTSQTSNALSFQVLQAGNTGTFTANTMVSDAEASTSNTLTFKVSPPFVSSAFYAFSSQINTTEFQLITANTSGGTSPYTYNFLIYNASGILVANQLTSGTTSNSVFFLYRHKPSWGAGVFMANVITTDSATTQEVASNTLSYTVTTSSSSGGSGGSGGGGGGGGQSGGGSGGLIIIPIPNGFVAEGAQAPKTFNVTVDGIKFNYTVNFITPNTTAITVNNFQYVLSPNETTTVNQTQNPNYIFTMQLLNISYLPILHSISFKFLGTPHIIPINITAQNSTTDLTTTNSIPTVVNLLGEQTTLNITSAQTANKILTIQNLTGSKLIPLLPPGYQKELIQNISLRQNVNLSTKIVNATINLIMRYNCSIPFYKEIPFSLENSSWNQLTTYTVKNQECIVTFNITADPILALAEYVGPSTNTIQNKTNTTTIQNTTPIVKPQKPAAGIPIYYITVPVLVCILAAAAVVLEMRRMHKKQEARSQKAKMGKERKAKSKVKSKKTKRSKK